MKAKVVAPFDYSPQMKVGQEVEIDKLRRWADSSSGFMARVVGIWKEPRWFDLGWFIPESKSAQQSVHPTNGGLCAVCGKPASHHEDHDYVALLTTISG